MISGGVPLISVCMPCHNAQLSVKEAIDSALAQTGPFSVEVVVVEDCSTDGTAEILQGYETDARVRIIYNEKNLGAAGSRNRAVEQARGTYVAFLDSDDIWREGKLSRQLSRLQETGHALCCTGRELIKPDGTETGRVIGVRSLITYRQLLRMNSINCSSVLLPRETALAYPMMHEDSHEDYITWLKILRDKGPADGINEPLLLYRLSSSGKSGSKLHSAGMTLRVYRYAGLGPVRSMLCFISYAWNGVWKYLTAGLAGRRYRIGKE